MLIRKSKYNWNKRSIKSKIGEKKSRIDERTSTQKISYATQSEIDASLNFLLIKYADTFRRLAE